VRQQRRRRHRGCFGPRASDRVDGEGVIAIAALEASHRGGSDDCCWADALLSPTADVVSVTFQGAPGEPRSAQWRLRHSRSAVAAVGDVAELVVQPGRVLLVRADSRFDGRVFARCVECGERRHLGRACSMVETLQAPAGWTVSVSEQTGDLVARSRRRAFVVSVAPFPETTTTAQPGAWRACTASRSGLPRYWRAEAGGVLLSGELPRSSEA
jgi:hypothetical protein